MAQKYFLRLLILIIFLSQTNSFGQSVVINEIITDPQTDWSTNGFDGTDGGGNITNIDEAVELFIKTDGLDLTGWTIELNDTSPVTGNLTDSGAFSVSNYISSSGGTFTNTKNGDYLVLGNVDGSGAINNSVTIILKDNSATTIDTVTLGGGAGPSGNASSITDEAALRTVNGVDTNNDSADFSKGAATLGSTNSPGVLSSNSFNKPLEVNIYPNPVTNGEFYIKSSNSKEKNVEVYNILGRRLISTKINTNDKIDVSNLNAGIYLLKINEGDKQLTKKIVIK